MITRAHDGPCGPLAAPLFDSSISRSLCTCSLFFLPFSCLGICDARVFQSVSIVIAAAAEHGWIPTRCCPSFSASLLFPGKDEIHHKSRIGRNLVLLKVVPFIFRREKRLVFTTLTNEGCTDSLFMLSFRKNKWLSCYGSFSKRMIVLVGRSRNCYGEFERTVKKNLLSEKNIIIHEFSECQS